MNYKDDAERPVAKCHPDRKHYARGLCAQCYKKWRLENVPGEREKVRAQQRRAYQRNREKRLAWQKHNYYNNPDYGADRAYGYRLQQKYGISVDTYLTMHREQDGKCAICGMEQTNGRRLALDHDHRTGQNRALLCDRCNLILGRVDDDPKLLRNMAEYLERFYKACEGGK